MRVRAEIEADRLDVSAPSTPATRRWRTARCCRPSPPAGPCPNPRSRIGTAPSRSGTATERRCERREGRCVGPTGGPRQRRAPARFLRATPPHDGPPDHGLRLPPTAHPGHRSVHGPARAPGRIPRAHPRPRPAQAPAPLRQAPARRNVETLAKSPRNPVLALSGPTNSSGYNTPDRLSGLFTRGPFLRGP